MVGFDRYVAIAYEVARSKRVSVEDPADFMSQLARAYRQNNHAEATEQQARRFLQSAIQ